MDLGGSNWICPGSVRFGDPRPQASGDQSVAKTMGPRELVKPERTVCKKNNTIERADQARQNCLQTKTIRSRELIKPDKTVFGRGNFDGDFWGPFLGPISGVIST
jgi:hypothetical protein